jgi:hypothetical protein
MEGQQVQLPAVSRPSMSHFRTINRDTGFLLPDRGAIAGP